MPRHSKLLRRELTTNAGAAHAITRKCREFEAMHELSIHMARVGIERAAIALLTQLCHFRYGRG